MIAAEVTPCAARYCITGTVALPGESGLSGLGEKLFGSRAASEPIESETRGMFVPLRTWAPPLSTTVFSPTKASTSLDNRCVSERFVPASSRSSAVTSSSWRPHTPPVLLT